MRALSIEAKVRMRWRTFTLCCLARERRCPQGEKIRAHHREGFLRSGRNALKVKHLHKGLVAAFILEVVKEVVQRVPQSECTFVIVLHKNQPLY